jgi:hypothetical protein
MKNITFLLLCFLAFQTELLKAQVYKRITGIDSIGYSKNYPPYLHSGFRFTYPNNTVGNGEEVRSLYVYHTFPNNFYSDCYLYNQFQFSTMKDTVNGYDTVHHLSRANNALIINSKEKVLTNANGLPSAYYDGSDTISRFYYNSNGQIISEVYKSTNKYAVKKSTYQYNNQNKLISTYTEDYFPDYFYSLFKYNSSGTLIEKTDSAIINDNTNGSTYVTYITRYKFKWVGPVLIINTSNGNGNSDDSMYYNSSGKLDRIKSSDAQYGTNVFYYYDSANYLDSVVYKRYYQTDKVVLYWETYTPNTSGISKLSTANANTINVYPNPSNGCFNIELNTGSTMTIVNSLGQTIQVTGLKQGQNTFNGMGLAKGIYFLRFGELNECRTIVIE